MTLLDTCELIVDCPHSTAKDEGAGFPLIRTPNIGKGRLILDGVHRVCKDVYNERNTRAVPQPGDLILAREAPVGNVAVIQECQQVCLGQRTVLIRPDKSKVDSNFLAYYLLSPPMQHLLLTSANGATVSHLNMADIRKLEINLPILEKQKKLGKILAVLDDKIETNTKINRNLSEQALAYYKEFKRKLGEKDDTQVEFQDNKKFGTLVMGLSPKGDSYNTDSEGLPLLNGAADYTGLMLTPTKFTSSPTRTCGLGDIVFCIRATIGLTVFADRQYCIGRGVASITNINEKYKEYIFQIINESIDIFKKNANGSVILGISKDDVLKLKVFDPSEDDIEKFHDLMKPMFEQMEKLRLENMRLADLRDSLLPKLMSGELDVSEIDL